jgi:flagellar biosynthesis protein FlhF
VGKTTTVAKLAATFSLRYGIKVGLITIDTYRIAAPEQLKVYGRIMEVPTLVASTAVEFSRALASLDQMDLVLVDTVGRSPADGDNLDEMARILSGAPRSVCHLVLACPTRDGDQQEAVKAYARLKPQRLIFTKLDETKIFGPILNQIVRTGWPVSHLAFGQKVPDDLEEAERDGLARRLLPPRNTAKMQ